MVQVCLSIGRATCRMLTACPLQPLSHQERPRWPALPLAGLTQESPKPAAAVLPAAPSRFPYLFGLVGGEGSKTTESKITSKIDSISDWQRHATGTPDTSASVHRPRLHDSPMTKLPALPEPSTEELLSETAMNSLVNGYVAEGEVLPASLPETRSSSSATNNAGKAWNWFKRAGSAIKPPLAQATTESEIVVQSTANSNGHLAVAGARSRDTSSQPLQIRHLPKRPSKHDMQSHKHTISKPRPLSRQGTQQITAEIETLLQDQRSPVGSAPGLEGPNETDEIWGPGALVLDDGISESSIPFEVWQDTAHPPWWARPVETLDERSRRKLGLKPLHLKRNDEAVPDRSETEKISKDTKQDRKSSREPGRPSAIPTSNDRAADSGKVSPGVPLIGQRRMRTSKAVAEVAKIENARPLPADMPESPFSSRRFTKVDTVRSGHKAAPSKGPFPQDALPAEESDALTTKAATTVPHAPSRPLLYGSVSHHQGIRDVETATLARLKTEGGEVKRMWLSLHLNLLCSLLTVAFSPQ